MPNYNVAVMKATSQFRTARVTDVKLSKHSYSLHNSWLVLYRKAQVFRGQSSLKQKQLKDSYSHYTATEPSASVCLKQSML
jgi:hypothetical protein